jgi:uncharacterized protein YbcI
VRAAYAGPMQDVFDDNATDRRAVLMEISNEMVRLYKHQFGRGPTAVRSYWAGPDVLTVVLEDTLSPAERNLVRMGEHERLRETRLFFQYASVREFCEPVERLTARRCRAGAGRRPPSRAHRPACRSR